MIFLKIYFGKTIIDDSVAGNVQGFKNFKIWPFLQILSFKLFLIAYTLSLCHIEAPHIVRNWPNFSWIQFDILDMVLMKLFHLKIEARKDIFLRQRGLPWQRIVKYIEEMTQIAFRKMIWGCSVFATLGQSVAEKQPLKIWKIKD